MLKFTNQATYDLSRILACLISFRIGGASIPALTQEHAESIYDDILDNINTIPSRPLHLRNSFDGLERYGEFVYSYKRNRTTWYAFYDKSDNQYIVNRITNNWNLNFPRL